MMKKALGIIICLCVTSYFSAAYAHGTFTWFGFRNDNAEVMINSGTPHHGPACGPHDCGHRKPKPPKPKHKHHKKPPKHHEHNRCFWWRCD